LTVANYQPLNDLQELYGHRDFEVIGFPCNQFGLQEPGASSYEIMNGIKYCRPGNGFQPNFDLTTKVDVVGKNAHHLWKNLTKSCPEPQRAWDVPKNMLNYTMLKSTDIRWNFEKFLIRRNGIPAYRFEPHFSPRQMNTYIEELLEELP